MYRNLLAEMKRNDIKNRDIADCIGVSARTASNKINGRSEFSWKETCSIQRMFFPNLTKEYLFDTDSKTSFGA